MDSSLRPLPAAALIDRAAVFWRAHFRPLFRLYLAMQLATYTLSKLFLIPFYRAFPFMRTGKPPPVEQILERLPQLGVAIVLLIVLLAVVWWLSWQGVIAGTHYTVQNLLGRNIELGPAISRALRRAGTTTVALLITGIWGLGVYVLSLLPGLLIIVVGAVSAQAASKTGGILLIVLGALVMVVTALAALLWLVLRFFLLPPVLSEEDGGPFDAIERAGVLMSGRVGPGFFGLVKVRASVLLTGLGAMLIVIAVIGSMPAIFVQSVYGNIFSPGHQTPDAVPQALLIPAELLQVGVQAAFSPLSIVLAALFYMDLRFRREGLDLESRLQSLNA